MEALSQKDYVYCSELKPIPKGKVDRIDETPAVIELTEALATKEYKLLRLERLDPAKDDIFLIKVQDTKPIDRKLGTVENPVHQVFSDVSR